MYGVETLNGLYEAIFRPEPGATAMFTEPPKTGLWHRRLGHVGINLLGKTIHLVNGMDIDVAQKMGICESCAVNKSCRKNRPVASKESRLSTKPLDLVHTDILGPVNPKSLGQSQY